MHFSREKKVMNVRPIFYLQRQKKKNKTESSRWPLVIATNFEIGKKYTQTESTRVPYGKAAFIAQCDVKKFKEH